MEKLFEAHLDLLRGCHREMLKAMEGLPSEALDWSPGPGMNSISVLVFHTTGSERFWIGDVALGEPSNRDRAAEFRVHSVGMEALRKRLDDSLAYAEGALARLSLDDLRQTRLASSEGRTVTVAWAILHALEHASIHLGHIQVTRDLWRQTRPEG
ncbi:MAG: DinB family protein [Bacteroidota bacterium]